MLLGTHRDEMREDFRFDKRRRVWQTETEESPDPQTKEENENELNERWQAKEPSAHASFIERKATGSPKAPVATP
jgi:hypothetical protein